MRHSLLCMLLLPVLSGAAFADTQDLILPIALNGYTTPPVHYQTIIRIVNVSSSAAQVTLEAYQNDGTPIRILELFPIARTGTKTVFQINGGGSVEAFTAEDVPQLNGWIRLTFDTSASIQASAEVALIKAPPGPHPICVRPSTDIVTSVQVPGVRASTKFDGFAVIRPYRKSGYAIPDAPCQIARGFHQAFLRRMPMGLGRSRVVMSRLRVKVPKRNIVPLSVDEVARFWSSFRTSRDFAIVGLMLLNGLRSAEVLALNRDDVLLSEAHGLMRRLQSLSREV